MRSRPANARSVKRLARAAALSVPNMANTFDTVVRQGEARTALPEDIELMVVLRFAPLAAAPTTFTTLPTSADVNVYPVTVKWVGLVVEDIDADVVVYRSILTL